MATISSFRALPIILSILLSLAFLTHATPPIRAMFLFKDILKSNTTALTSSGFNTFILFGLGITANADIKYYSNTPGSSDIVVASGGSYVGGTALSAKMRSFKWKPGTNQTTGIDRLEISMNSQNVKNLMGNPGAGKDTILARNFAALKENWFLDAVNNDDESLYDVASTVTFGKMLGSIGYKYTISPYTNTRFWTSVTTQLNSGLSEPNLLMDRVYLQCYDGGAGNNPASWRSSLGMKVTPLVWVTNDSKPGQGTTANQARSKFAGWHGSANPGNLAGGGYWNDYDIEKMKLDYKAYGDVLTSVFK